MNLGYFAQWQALLGPILGDTAAASSVPQVASGLPLPGCPHSGCVSITACGAEVQKWCDCAFPASVDPNANERCKMGLGMTGGINFCLLEPPWMGGGARARNIPGPFDASAIGCFALDPLNLTGVKTAGVPGYQSGSPPPAPQSGGVLGLPPSSTKYVVGGIAAVIVLAALSRRRSPPSPSPSPAVAGYRRRRRSQRYSH